MENMKKCKKCQGRVIEDLIDYKTEILGEDIVIAKVDGFRCLECGYTEIDKTILKGLENKILDKKLELQKEKIKKYKTITINNVRRIRESKKIPQKKIGEALGYSEQRFGAIERNDNTPIITTSLQIAEALEVPMEELYQLKYVTKAFYDTIKNLTAIEIKNEDGVVTDIEFKVIDDLVEVNKQFYDLEEEINKKMEILRNLKKTDAHYKDIKQTEKEIRELKKDKKGKKNKNLELTEEEKKALIKKKQERIANFSKYPSVVDINNKEDEIKELKRKKNNILKKKREIENKENCILKQSQCIDGEIFEILKNKYSKEYNTMYE